MYTAIMLAIQTKYWRRVSSQLQRRQHEADTVKAETRQAQPDLCAAKMAGSGRAPAFLWTWLEQLGEAISSTSLSRSALSSRIRAQKCVGPAPNTARSGQSRAHSNCACAVLLIKSGETQACLHFSATSDKGEVLLCQEDYRSKPVNAV